jgi:O-methyltransferase
MNIFEMLDAVRDLPDGDYAECGVWQAWMARKISAGMNPDARLYLLDSFEGHAEPTEFDDAIHHPKGRYSNTSIGLVAEAVPGATILAGFIPETFEAIEGCQFRFVHIDVDHYLPTKAACEFFKTRMVAGGIIRFDDYMAGECPGATLAVDEVFGRENILPADYRWIKS